jgi:hypothetical protein
MARFVTVGRRNKQKPKGDQPLILTQVNVPLPVSKWQRIVNVYESEPVKFSRIVARILLSLSFLDPGCGRGQWRTFRFIVFDILKLPIASTIYHNVILDDSILVNRDTRQGNAGRQANILEFHN